MFTGIVEELGTVKEIKRQKNLFVLSVSAKKVQAGTKLGDSISVSGVCLTVAKKTAGTLSFDVMKETIDTTSLKTLKPKSTVNLERALRANDRLGGHFVTGHVDCVGKVIKKIDKPNYTEVRVSIPKKLKKYFIPKGSVCVDGVSLTVGEARANSFSFYLIPFTKDVTTLGRIKLNDTVNVETDILAKYILNGS